MAISAALSLSPYVQYWVPFFGGLIEAPPLRAACVGCSVVKLLLPFRLDS
jgi:hypothetical protein